jgi:3-phenylpropionate/trans-cinnamate dioxygenase ferredoxin reductase subunit
VELVPGTLNARLDPGAKLLASQAGERFGYGSLIWATGGVPRRLRCEGGDLASVHLVRCKAEVDRILAELPDARRIAVIGGGYIGLETAAALRKLGKDTVVIEALDRVLARTAST